MRPLPLGLFVVQSRPSRFAVAVPPVSIQMESYFNFFVALENSISDFAALIPCIAFIGLIGLILFLIIKGNNDAQKAKSAAWYAYQDALAKVRSNPTNANVRQQALYLGRTYSNLTRSKQGVTVYDEVALMNDINAASAGASYSAATERPIATTSRSLEERLAQLSELSNKGLISEQEYTSRKQKILDEI
jgi:hypothetical protein